MFLLVGECLTTKLLFLLILLPTVSSWSGEEEGHKIETQRQNGDEKGEQKNSDANVFRVFRIFARTWEDVRALSALRAIAQENPEIDFWLDSVHPGQFADVMVSPLGMPIFRHFLRSNPSLKVQITVEDVEKLILRNEFRPRLERMARLRRRLKRGGRWIQRRSIVSPLFDQLRGAHYPFGEYTGYSAMIRYLRTLEFYYPNLVQLIQIGATHEGRSIEGVKIGHNPMTAKGKPKRAFWIDGNMHAREWASSHTALFIINQLVANYGRDPFLTNALNRVDFYIVPCANPDGFEFSRSSMNPKIRLWRKNRSPEQCTRTWSGLLCCRGVDLNRNFDFHWAETGSSLNACSNLFAGKRAFSEPEARAIANFLQADELRGRLDAFITLHTYAQMWIHPFSHEYQLYPKDVQKLKSLALRATSRLKEIYGTTYRVGTGADLLAPASGGSDDWAKEKLGVKFVYLIELRPQLDLSNGFILRQEELLPTAYETFEAIKEVIRGVLLENGLPTNLVTNGTVNGGGNNSSPFPSTQTTSIPSSESSTTTFLSSTFSSSKTAFSTTNSNQSLSLLPTTISMTNVGKNELTTSKTSQLTSTQFTRVADTTMNSESTATLASIKQGTTAQTSSSTTSILSQKTTATMGKQKEEISEKTLDDDFIVFVPNSTSSPSINTKMTAESRHRIFTLPWVPTRRVTVTPMSTTVAEGQRIQPSTITMGTNPQPVSSAMAQSTTSSPSPITILFTATEPSWEETNEIDVLPTQMTPPPLLRTASKFLGSDSLHKFGVHRWERNNGGGKLVELKDVGDNLTVLLEASAAENSTLKTTQIVPIISWPTRKCSDEKSSCAFWIRAHRPVCVEQRRYMQRNCAFSCGFCRIGN